MSAAVGVTSCQLPFSTRRERVRCASSSSTDPNASQRPVARRGRSRPASSQRRCSRPASPARPSAERLAPGCSLSVASADRVAGRWHLPTSVRSCIGRRKTRRPTAASRPARRPGFALWVFRGKGQISESHIAHCLGGEDHHDFVVANVRVLRRGQLGFCRNEPHVP